MAVTVKIASLSFSNDSHPGIHCLRIIGSFSACHTIFLSTLPRRELIAGYAEVIKYGIIYDKNFFNWLNNNIRKLLKNDSFQMIRAIKRSVEIKKEFIIKDEKDLNNKRALLNFGHTFAHGFEAAKNFSKKISHGEAVLLGMTVANELSYDKKILPLKDLMLIKKHYFNLNLPIKMSKFFKRKEIFIKKIF